MWHSRNIKINKIQGKENIKDDLLDWLYFLENPKSERVTNIMEKNKEIKEATKKSRCCCSNLGIYS